MNGYNVDELYYLYRQGCPIAHEYLIRCIYLQINGTVTSYYNRGLYFAESEEYRQIIMIKCLRALESYRPDRGMSVKSFCAMVIRKMVFNFMTRKSGKIVKEAQVLYSLDEYYDIEQHYSKADSFGYSNSFEDDIKAHEIEVIINNVVDNCFSKFEKQVFVYRYQGYKVSEIAKKLNIDARKVYNANYRIQKKLAKFKSN